VLDQFEAARRRGRYALNWRALDRHKRGPQCFMPLDERVERPTQRRRIQSTSQVSAKRDMIRRA
jgi:hypothetical protein